jgi:hypothetical protein
VLMSKAARARVGLGARVRNMMESPPTANICKHSTHSRPANPQDDNHTADNHIVVRPHSTSKNRFQWYFFYAPRPAGILLQKRMSPTRRVAVHQKRRNHSLLNNREGLDSLSLFPNNIVPWSRLLQGPQPQRQNVATLMETAPLACLVPAGTVARSPRSVLYLFVPRCGERRAETKITNKCLSRRFLFDHGTHRAGR